MDCLVAVTVTHHTHEANSQVVVVGDMPGSACPPKPVGVISVGTVCLVQEAVVARVGPFRYATTFHLAVPVVEAGVSVYFTAAVVDVSARVVTSIGVGSRFNTAIVTRLTVFLEDDIDDTRCSFRAVFC